MLNDDLLRPRLVRGEVVTSTPPGSSISSGSVDLVAIAEESGIADPAWQALQLTVRFAAHLRRLAADTPAHKVFQAGLAQLAAATIPPSRGFEASTGSNRSMVPFSKRHQLRTTTAFVADLQELLCKHAHTKKIWDSMINIDSASELPSHATHINQLQQALLEARNADVLERIRASRRLSMWYAKVLGSPLGTKHEFHRDMMRTIHVPLVRFRLGYLSQKRHWTHDPDETCVVCTRNTTRNVHIAEHILTHCTHPAVCALRRDILKRVETEQRRVTTLPASSFSRTSDGTDYTMFYTDAIQSDGIVVPTHRTALAIFMVWGNSPSPAPFRGEQDIVLWRARLHNAKPEDRPPLRREVRKMRKALELSGTFLQQLWALWNKKMRHL